MAVIWHFVMLCGLLVICECQKHGPFEERQNHNVMNNSIYSSLIEARIGMLSILESEHCPDRYIGCYKDDIDRVLEISAHENSSYALTWIDECIRTCSRRGYTFAGTGVWFYISL
ncbi:hypothetical protein CAPTEDRAFT_206206 [Capitella teleta]|uniref:Uncharacterized protein n=1 Tax=Capitella teleta TaxID=283909 RepID=R7UVE9_CAPTE|nr:hypothetical protein CAPTEDRAFT_206206 [Capitella teleta]|eukprot:ELU07937.1 hypothetical protein CAPTEDRAFT_206206 [Capitella teleta]